MNLQMNLNFGKVILTTFWPLLIRIFIPVNRKEFIEIKTQKYVIQKTCHSLSFAFCWKNTSIYNVLVLVNISSYFHFWELFEQKMDRKQVFGEYVIEKVWTMKWVFNCNSLYYSYSSFDVNIARCCMQKPWNRHY